MGKRGACKPYSCIWSTLPTLQSEMYSNAGTYLHRFQDLALVARNNHYVPLQDTLGPNEVLTSPLMTADAIKMATPTLRRRLDETNEREGTWLSGPALSALGGDWSTLRRQRTTRLPGQLDRVANP